MTPSSLLSRVNHDWKMHHKTKQANFQTIMKSSSCDNQMFSTSWGTVFNEGLSIKYNLAETDNNREEKGRGSWTTKGRHKARQQGMCIAEGYYGHLCFLTTLTGLSVYVLVPETNKENGAHVHICVLYLELSQTSSQTSLNRGESLRYNMSPIYHAAPSSIPRKTRTTVNDNGPW